VLVLIYILEDDDNIRKLVRYALIREGYEVEDFAEPSSFHKAMANKQPELVILDLMLPEEDGLTILSNLRAEEPTRRLPIIILTAKDSEFDKANGLDKGADDYISKPFGIVELMSRVKAVLRRAAGQRIIRRASTRSDSFLSIRTSILSGLTVRMSICPTRNTIC